MTLRKHKRTGCRKKLRYHSIEEAKLEIERALTFRGETLRWYECGDHLHLTAMTIEQFEKWGTHGRDTNDQARRDSSSSE